MDRLVLSPKATALARLLHSRLADHQASTCILTDHEVGALLGFEADTVYRALCELRDLGALTFSRKGWNAPRKVVVDRSSWVWAFAAATPKAGA